MACDADVTQSRNSVCELAGAMDLAAAAAVALAPRLKRMLPSLTRTSR